MNRRFAVVSFLFIQLAALAGLLFSGILSADSSAVTITAAIIGSVAIATLVWVAVYFLIQPLKKHERGTSK